VLMTSMPRLALGVGDVLHTRSPGDGEHGGLRHAAALGERDISATKRVLVPG
jgi:hypothetical protein